MPIYSYNVINAERALTGCKSSRTSFDALPGVQGAGQATHSTGGIVFKGFRVVHHR